MPIVAHNVSKSLKKLKETASKFTLKDLDGTVSKVYNFTYGGGWLGLDQNQLNDVLLNKLKMIDELIESESQNSLLFSILAHDESFDFFVTCIKDNTLSFPFLYNGKLATFINQSKSSEEAYKCLCVHTHCLPIPTQQIEVYWFRTQEDFFNQKQFDCFRLYGSSYIALQKAKRSELYSRLFFAYGWKHLDTPLADGEEYRFFFSKKGVNAKVVLNFREQSYWTDFNHYDWNWNWDAGYILMGSPNASFKFALIESTDCALFNYNKGEGYIHV